MNKFDQVVLGSLDIAHTEALKRKNPELHPEHLLLGLVLNKSTYASKALKDNLKEIEGFVEKLPKTTGQLALERSSTARQKLHALTRPWWNSLLLDQ